ncbi:hypothetical protein D3C75_873350 [compost metagenome]
MEPVKSIPAQLEQIEQHQHSPFVQCRLFGLHAELDQLLCGWREFEIEKERVRQMLLPPQPVNQMRIARRGGSIQNILPGQAGQILFDYPFLVYIDFLGTLVVIVNAVHDCLIADMVQA